jgi:hypothetical protein
VNTFTWLLLGHFLGDWMLQNDWMARGKKKAFLTLPGTVHFTIYTMATVGVLWLSGVRDKGAVFFLTVGLIIFVSHWLVDATNMVEWWMRFYRQSNLDSVRVMVDQTLHLLVLAVLTVLLIKL